MPRSFTHYWQNSTWANYRTTLTTGELPDYAASNLFGERGVAPGDHLYIVTVLRGALYLLTKFEVAKVCGQEEAAETLGYAPEDMWDAGYYVISAATAPADFDREVSLATVVALRFVAGDGDPRPLKFKQPGVIDQQTLRGVRELTPESAALLDQFLQPVQRLNLERRKAMLEALPELVLDPGRYYEGAITQVTVNAFERNRQARQACIAIHGVSCVACGFNFEERYGDVAAGYIHVHHLRPLASIGAEYKLDPAHDLVPVCPNCHAVMHLRREEPYTVEEIQAMLGAS